MTLSRSPSPHPGGGWSSPGLIPASGTTSPGSLSPGGISWAAAKSKSEEVRGYPSFSTRNSGFFSRQRHKISTWFPSFRRVSSHDYIDKDDYGRNWKRASGIVQTYRRSPIGGGSKFVIILGSNVEGGVMEWKGAREWAIERNSIWNKRRYAEKWGYELELANLLAKKRYSHEWRESWEKGDVIREAMRKYPDAEWFWWLDLNTWVMEYDISLQQHLFNDLKSHVYRDITAYNPLNITHPLPEFWLDELGRSLEGDGQADSLNMLLTQDCAGFNLGSFFLRRSLWTDRLLDIWWDPVMYEQMHMEWEHKEQDALEYIYQSQPWVRSGVGFLPQRSINAFPPGACGDGENPVIHYQQNAHDLVVNMAGCIFGRDCWSEIYYYRELSNWLGRSGWEQFRDGLTDLYDRMTGKDKDD
ncbi:Alpha-1,6-mannosyltransferase subunit, putative [Penicillium digitatum PHI26]|uniref:Alpha-1,6-mannosyltransferase subunit, putative n=1 Tax=Penicillium digitatum (strain PHI26 / CECT 20796) TaxID=1170229 RepID=K9FBE5_PEND2|nr:Alpha-1,6-mannosyltransferase subunit, putative [Penicillium digitatum PHI26]